MPYARMKPLNPKLGYELRSFSHASGIRMSMGDDPEHPIWHKVTQEQEKILQQQRITRDKGSPCKFDIFPTLEAARAFEEVENRAAEEKKRGRTVDTAVSLDPNDPDVPVPDSEKALRARIAELEEQNAALKRGDAAAASAPARSSGPVTSADTGRRAPGRRGVSA